MILVDSSVWIDHLRSDRPELRRLLEEGLVRTHPFIIGELACGNLRNRSDIIRHLSQLPSVESADHDGAMHLLNARGLSGRGISWVDVHLLASALVSHVELWTLDQRLASAARELRIAANGR
ncbi:MAG: type II toxin-antitoxin system VapC family toxin [Gemmatimonadota bacterium]